ncbi:MAG: helix-turn-helix domain-containing protein [Lentimicrobium sp.]
MDFILISGIFMALLISALLQSKKGKQPSDDILSAYFLLFAITQVLSFIEMYNRENTYPFPAFINTSTPFIFLHGPLLWFYIKSLTVNNFKFRVIHLFHFLPFVLVTTLFWYTIYRLPAELRIAADAGLFKNQANYPVIITGIALSTQGYFLWGILLIRNYNRRLKDWLSQTASVDLHWLRFLLISAIVAYAAISLLYAFDYRFNLFPGNLLQPSGFGIAAVFVVILGFFGLKQGNLFVSNPGITLAEEPIGLKSEPATVSGKDEQFVNELLIHMREQKPYLDPELNITKLSNDLKVSTEYLSGILNGRLNMNFFDFINHYRIEEFKVQCRTPENNHLSIMGIAFDCGFNSKATFNRVFKKATNLTPSEFKQKSQ